MNSSVSCTRCYQCLHRRYSQYILLFIKIMWQNIPTLGISLDYIQKYGFSLCEYIQSYFDMFL